MLYRISTTATTIITHNLKIATEKIYGSLAVCGDGQDQAWLYFLKGNPGVICLYDLKLKIPNQLSVSNVLDGSYLAACFDTTKGQNHILYQSSKTPPIIVHAQGISGGDSDEIANTDTAAANTPIAVCANPKQTQIQIYYKSNADSMVHRVSWNPAERHAYSDATEVGEARMNQFSSIAAVAAPDGSGVHVFYVYQQDDSTRALAHVVDNWHTPSN
ncbi:hypothetical protein B0T25DRAFT_574918 [Lasiosphaeria hispida]|uniref:Fucose-specific lectin n=1 Tax=Lasiosphaeria hispida TaxID=260671 RepID=A0AAJ0H4Z4_9PEZI|nr:hypothetical protein B0T25DRAFT_574918 [Lasiosphaeria hispida]